MKIFKKLSLMLAFITLAAPSLYGAQHAVNQHLASAGRFLSMSAQALANNPKDLRLAKRLPRLIQDNIALTQGINFSGVDNVVQKLNALTAQAEQIKATAQAKTPAIISENPLLTPKLPAPSAPPQDNPLEFSILSSNVLNEHFYEKNFNPKSKYTNLLEQRDNQFNDLVDKFNPDIIALQEYNNPPNLQQVKGTWKGTSPLLRAPYSVRVENAKGDLHLSALIGPNKDYKFKRPNNPMDLDPKGKLNTIVAAKSEKFKTPGAENHGFLYFALESKDNNKLLGVIDTQLAGGVPKGQDGKPDLTQYDSFREKQLNEIVRFINNYNTHPVDAWIIAGDFNWPWKADGAAANWAKKNGFKLSSTKATLYKPGTPATKAANQKVDYILYKRLDLVKEQVIPDLGEINDQLSADTKVDVIQHAPGDKNKRFYSDHAAILATFKFQNQQP